MVFDECVYYSKFDILDSTGASRDPYSRKSDSCARKRALGARYVYALYSRHTFSLILITRKRL
ncbi:hypothetical protein C0J52_01339 [Blattella germanica]|nr:hypothetical protein C0J52_01339 [Blattella germanica]